LIDGAEKFNAYMTQHNDRLPLLSVESIEDKRFVELRKTLSDIYGEVENDACSVSQYLSRFLHDLSSIEPHDRRTFTGLLSKYQVKGEVRPVSGVKTYGYDLSRLDRKMYKRKRSN
tara:strand:- start:540 stop:887 length:348 start_codon:yes stop_codon:yes gene_type:complete